MQHVGTSIASLAPGARLVLGPAHGYSLNPPVRSVVTIESVSDGYARGRETDGSPVTVHAASRNEFFVDDSLRKDGTGPSWRSDRRRRTAVWTDALPKGDDAAVLAYVDAVLASDRLNSSGAAVVHLVCVGAGDARGRLCFNAGDAGRSSDRFAEEGRFTGEIVGGAAVCEGEILLDPAALPEGSGPGDLVIGRELVLESRDDGTFVGRLSSPSNLGNFPDAAAVGAFLPWGVSDGPIERSFWDGGHLASDVEFEEARWRATAMTQPDEALVLWHEDGPTLGMSVLSTTGIQFHHSDDAGDYLQGSEMRPGLWLFFGARWSVHHGYEGDVDVDLDGDWRPATREDLSRHGISDAEVEDALDDAIGPGNGGATEAYIAMAVEAAEAEAAARPAAVPA